MGAKSLFATDDFFADKSRILKPESPQFMVGKFDDNGKWMDGWETRRRREPGNDWCILALGQLGAVESIEIDTSYFKDNFPDEISVQAVYAPNTPDKTLITQSMLWDTLLDNQKTAAHEIHTFGQDKFKSDKPITHVRVNIFPDGGLSRVRIYGKVASDSVNSKATS